MQLLHFCMRLVQSAVLSATILEAEELAGRGVLWAWTDATSYPPFAIE